MNTLVILAALTLSGEVVVVSLAEPKAKHDCPCLVCDCGDRCDCASPSVLKQPTKHTGAAQSAPHEEVAATREPARRVAAPTYTASVIPVSGPAVCVNCKPAKAQPPRRGLFRRR